MRAYVLGILPMLHFLLDSILTNELQSKEVAFTDDLILGGKLVDIKNLGDKVAAIGPKYGYSAKATK